jgi:hypothetical protein
MKNVYLFIIPLIFIFYGCENQPINTISTERYETTDPLKASIKKLLGRYKDVQTIGICARRFNNRLKDSESGWLSKYDLNNVVVFDLYDILTKDGQSNWAGYPTKNGTDSHPSSEGNSIAAERFVPFLNKAVRRAGLDPPH